MAVPARRALLTGGTGRVGRVVAERLRAERHSVLAAGRADGDLARADGAKALVARALEELGGLDLVVHAASDGFEARPVAEVDEELWDRALGATAKGAFFVAQAAAPALREADDGLVVLIEDVASYEPWPR
jgi:3-oxoacyl-[acyl-carrier protein] reductase